MKPDAGMAVVSRPATARHKFGKRDDDDDVESRAESGVGVWQGWEIFARETMLSALQK